MNRGFNGREVGNMNRGFNGREIGRRIASWSSDRRPAQLGALAFDPGLVTRVGLDFLGSPVPAVILGPGAVGQRVVELAEPTATRRVTQDPVRIVNCCSCPTQG
jgi:hypothetical protein